MTYNVGQKSFYDVRNTSYPIKRKNLFTTKATHLRTGKVKTLGPGKGNTLDQTEGKTPVFCVGWGRSRVRVGSYIYIHKTAPKKIPLSRGFLGTPP